MMKSYPIISYKVDSNIDYYVFDKLDGSCIRAEWSSMKGFWKFGTRRRLLDESEFLGKAIGLIREKYGKDLSTIFYDNKYGRVLCFFEFWGKGSFAGQHDESEEHTVTLIDVNPFKKGILSPKKFIDLFGKLDIPNVVYYGKISPSFIESIRGGKVRGVTYEGVVCKGMAKKRQVMFKIKSRKWIVKVRAEYGSGSNLLDATELLIEESKRYRQRRFCPNCFRNGCLSPTCICGKATLKMLFQAQPPRKRASKGRWRTFFQKWYPDLNFEYYWNKTAHGNDPCTR